MGRTRVCLKTRPSVQSSTSKARAISSGVSGVPAPLCTSSPSAHVSSLHPLAARAAPRSVEVGSSPHERKKLTAPTVVEHGPKLLKRPLMSTLLPQS